MPAIEDASKVVVVLDEGVGLVDQERGVPLLAAAVMLLLANGFGTSAPVRLSAVVLPHSGAGDVSARIGDISAVS